MTLRIGWIGCGRHATAMLLPQLIREAVVIAALCDLDGPSLAATGRRYGVTSLTTDWQELLRTPGLDMVGMAVGPALHAAAAAAAIERGLPVFMEKPPAPTAAEAERLLELAERHRVPVTVGFMKRYSAANRIAFNVVRTDEFGPALGFVGEYMTAPTYFVGEPDYSGFYLHHCVHAMDLAPWLMGPLRTIRTRAHEAGSGKLLLHLDLGFESGAIGTYVMGTIQARSTPMERWQVMGDHRRVEVENVFRVTYHRAPPFKVDDPTATLEPTSDSLTWQPNLTAAANEDLKGYRALLASALRLIRGEPSDAPTIADGVAAMHALEAMIRSRRSGQEEQIVRRSS